MPGPFGIAGAFPGETSQIRRCNGPFEHDGNLFTVALSVPDFGDEVLSVFKSADDGATWAPVGSSRTLGSGESGYFTGLGVCAHTDFPSTPYLYIAYVNPAHEMYVERFDVDAENFDLASGAGDVLGIGINPVLMIEHSPDGMLGLLVNYRNDPTFNEARVDVYSILDDLTGMVGPTEVADQSDGQGYVAGGIARGDSGRIHGFLQTGTDAPGGVGEIYHTLVLEAGGAIGAGSEFVAECNYNAIVSASYGGGQIALAYPGPGWAVPLDATGFLGVLTSIAPSDDSPAWDDSEVYSSAITGLCIYHNGSLFEVFYAPDPGDIERQVWDGLAWGSTQTLAPGPLFLPSVRAITDGVGIIYADSDFDDLWYLSVPVLSGPALHGETIPTGEFFFSTHGVTGGGGEVNCGPGGVEPTEPGCNPNPPTGPVDPAHRNTCPVPQGYVY